LTTVVSNSTRHGPASGSSGASCKAMLSSCRVAQPGRFRRADNRGAGRLIGPGQLVRAILIGMSAEYGPAVIGGRGARFAFRSGLAIVTRIAPDDVRGQVTSAFYAASYVGIRGRQHGCPRSSAHAELGATSCRCRAGCGKAIVTGVRARRSSPVAGPRRVKRQGRLIFPLLIAVNSLRHCGDVKSCRSRLIGFLRLSMD
jgi:hypothetical protein